jgi:alanine dehydrogenase
MSLVKRGHRVVVQSKAGEGSGFPDEEYERVGAHIVEKSEEVFARSDMVVKVKEPQKSEFDMLRPGLILFTFLHLASAKNVAEALLQNKITGIGYETVQTDDGSLPLLKPMSRIAGRLSIQIGAELLLKYNGGKGIMLGGAPGVEPGRVLIIGAGTVGCGAARIAIGVGASVAVMDINPVKLEELDDLYAERITTVMSNEYELERQVERADLLIGAVLIPGAKAPKIVTEEMVKAMKPGSVIVDVAIDQGGSIETVDRVTTHRDPSYIKHGVVHYSVANMPGAVPRTSSKALEGATLPYVLKIADKGLEALEDKSLLKGLNTFNGKLTNGAVAKSLNMKCSTY